MPLRNGQGRSLFDEMVGDAGARTIRAQPLFQQENLQQGLSSLTTGLHRPSPPKEPDFVQRPLRPRGVMDGFVKTCQRWGLAQGDQLILLGHGGDSEFLGLQLLLGRWLSPSQDVKDRAGYILGISIGLGSIFDEAAQAEVTWLKTAHPKLHGTSPLDLMLNGKMASLMTVARLVAEEREL
jgi:hypothetical protein